MSIANANSCLNILQVHGVTWDVILQHEGGLNIYLERMSRNGTWRDGIILEMAARLYKRPITIIPFSASEENKTISYHFLLN